MPVLLIVLSGLFDLVFLAYTHIAMTHIVREGVQAGISAPSAGLAGFGGGTSNQFTSAQYQSCTSLAVAAADRPANCGSIIVGYRISRLVESHDLSVNKETVQIGASLDSLGVVTVRLAAKYKNKGVLFSNRTIQVLMKGRYLAS